MIPKFRAYCKFNKTIYEVLLIDFKAKIEQIKLRKTGNIWYDFEDVILMQSTGIHDNNGVEIFEGDIVEHLDFNSNEISKSEVRILKGCFYLVISVDGFKYDVPMMDLKDDECILQIKGNVHENPELLEDV